MAPSPTLPPELLLTTFTHLSSKHSPSTHTTTLLNLCLSSRLLCNLARPFLYSTVHLAQSTPDPLRNVKAFLRTILRNEGLARCVRKVGVVGEGRVGFDWQAIKGDLCFMEILRLMAKEEGEEVGVEIEPDVCYYPLVVEVLRRLPKLEEVEVTAEVEQPRGLLGRMHEVQRERGVWRGLRRVVYHKKYENGPVDINDFIPFLTYPSFEELTTHCGPSTYRQSLESSNTIPTTNFLTPTDISLRWCVRPEASFRTLFATTPLLTSFTFILPSTYRHRTGSDVAYDPLITPTTTIHLLLTHYASTLRKLHLDFYAYYNLYDEDIQQELADSGGPLEQTDYVYPRELASFTSLTHATLEVDRVRSWDCLPENLEYVHLTKLLPCSGLRDGGLEGLLALRNRVCPRLKEGVVSGWIAGEWGDFLGEGWDGSRGDGCGYLCELEEGRVVRFTGRASWLKIVDLACDSTPLSEDQARDYGYVDGFGAAAEFGAGFGYGSGGWDGDDYGDVDVDVDVDVGVDVDVDV